MTAPLLQVDDLHITLQGDSASYNAVENVSFEIGRGEAFGLVGESSCGKSITALAVMGLLRRPLSLAGGKIVLDGQEIQHATPAEMRRLRGERIAMIFQEPMTALNPLRTIGDQIGEMLEIHTGLSKAEIKARVQSLLSDVHIPDPKAAAKAYPHELSGGQRQRAVIAMALALDPKVLLLDELSMGLAPLIVAAVMDVIRDINEAGTAVLLVEHDLEMVEQVVSRLYVLESGSLLAEGSVADVLGDDRVRRAYLGR
jgi:ABC-type glutathione transport system ATPase component